MVLRGYVGEGVTWDGEIKEVRNIGKESPRVGNVEE